MSDQSPLDTLANALRHPLGGTDSDAAAFVLKYGRPFVMAPLPKGVRRRRPGGCYAAAGGLALRGLGAYVEGFALAPGDLRPVKHAWITTTCCDAIDPSAPQFDPSVRYIGVPFSRRALSRLLLARGYHGLIDPIDAALRDALAEHPFDGCLHAA